MDRFEMALRPDLVDGILQKVWWVRAKYGHSIPVRYLHILSTYLFSFAHLQYRESTMVLSGYVAFKGCVIYITLLIHRTGITFVSSR